MKKDKDVIQPHTADILFSDQKVHITSLFLDAVKRSNQWRKTNVWNWNRGGHMAKTEKVNQ